MVADIVACIGKEFESSLVSFRWLSTCVVCTSYRDFHAEAPHDVVGLLLSYDVVGLLLSYMLYKAKSLSVGCPKHAALRYSERGKKLTVKK
jgi:hypothetical protein